MTATAARTADEQQQAYALIAGALSGGRRGDARLVTGEHRSFGVNAACSVVRVPHPVPGDDWTMRTVTCGIALQCAPSKDRLAVVDLSGLTVREHVALAAVEASVALRWVFGHWPGLAGECRRVLGDVEPAAEDLDAAAMLEAAQVLARSHEDLSVHAIFGRLPGTVRRDRTVSGSAVRRYGRMPWSSRHRHRQRIHSIPVGGEGGVQNPNLPPASRPEDEEIDVRPDERVGVPYPEWNMWTRQFLVDHVAVLERQIPVQATAPARVPHEVRRWFEQHTLRTMRGGLEDGTDLDIDRYVRHLIDVETGHASEPRLFRDLVPAARDVTSALLLDGSSSLGAHNGAVFELELACADALSQAMTVTRERHGVFMFSGNTRHRVDVRCLKDFDARHLVAPSRLGLETGGYTRLGAPLRHLTSRLLAQPSERRLLMVVGDGLMCDEGYEGRYAWADVEHAVAEAEDAGVAIYYIGVGHARVDPLPEVFGPQRSQRIKRLEELPRVLAQVHQELVAT